MTYSTYTCERCSFRRAFSWAMFLACALSWNVFGAEVAEPAEVLEWIVKLDDDSYETREQAVEKLTAVGAASVAPLEKVLAGDANLEVVVRGLNVLSTLASKGETFQIRDAAYEALARLSRTKGEVAAGHAESFLSVIRVSRQRDAIAWLNSRGANVSFEGESIEFGANWQGTDEDFSRLAYLYDIRILTMVGEQVTDQWLTHATKLPALREITLKKAKITTAGLKQLAEVKTLTALHVLYIRLDDEALDLLANMKQLTFVKLFGTGLNQDGVKQLAVRMPNVRLDVRPGGGFLGIGVQPHGAGVIVSNVQPRSAAQQAGVEIGDIMLSFGGEKVANFEQLQAAIGKFAPGDAVEVELIKTTKPEKVKIVLGEWESTLLR
jgi:hypothetical protein